MIAATCKGENYLEKEIRVKGIILQANSKFLITLLYKQFYYKNFMIKFFSIRCGSVLILLFFLQSCYYKPFASYYLNKKDFKHFSRAEKKAGDNSDPKRNYKVNRYDWAVEVNAQKEFMFDLQKRMKIKSFECSAGKPKLKRTKDLLIFKFKENIPANQRVKLTIHYKGHPANVAKQGPIQWKKDEKGRPWISTQTEGIGPHFIMPCNALLGNEADSVSITVTVPSELQVASNGPLVSTIANASTKTTSYRHEVTNPINIYNISFNIGHFVELKKPYTDINGIDREITFQVLDFNKERADTFYNQAPIVMKAFEEMFGEFPFWVDGCKFIESSFGAMEHQSGIALGNDYRYHRKDFNLTLIHELAHEWWGNSISGADYCDAWLHEGMATYCEALLLEKIYGKDDYDWRIRLNIRSTFNTIPILKKCDVMYNSWAQSRDGDIYSKGALMMHSIRKLMNNDSLFLASLKTIQTEFSKQNITTQQFIDRFNELVGQDYSAAFDWYLKKAKAPVVKIKLDPEQGKMWYKWDEEIPFYPQGEVQVKTDEDLFKLIPTTTYQSMDKPKEKRFIFWIEQTIYYMIEIEK